MYYIKIDGNFETIMKINLKNSVCVHNNKKKLNFVGQCYATNANSDN